jgi:quinol monooxygenase YgiN
MNYPIFGQKPIRNILMVLLSLALCLGLILCTRAQSEKRKPTSTTTEGADAIGSKAMIIITSIHYTFAAKDADKAESLFRELRAASLKEPGVVEFEVGRSSDELNVFALWEVYRDKAAADAHRASEHFKRLVIGEIRPLSQQRNAVTVIPIRETQ